MAKTILVIDDIVTERIHLRKILEGLNFVVIEAASGSEGIALAQSAKPDLILMDVVMPEMSGFQATRNLKKNPETEKIPVVMVTSKNRDPDKENAKENGAVAYIVKPATAATLKSVIDKVIDKVPA